MKRTKNLTLMGLLLAVGLLLPQVFHILGGPAIGRVFLPMHLSVFLAGLFLGPLFGGVAGLLIPLLSSLLTGGAMPAVAILPFMTTELVLYGATAGFLYHTSHVPLIPSLVTAQVAGRLGNAAALWIAATWMHLPVSPASSVLTALSTGIPGIALQWVLIPLLVLALKKGTAYGR